MKPVLLIDFDGTLCHDRFWRSLEPDLLKMIQGYIFGYDKDLVMRWMNGEYTSEDIHARLAADLGIDYDHAWQVFVNDCENMAIEKGILEDISNLRDRYNVILCTDNMDCFTRFTVPAIGLQNYFDEIVNSSERKISKMDNNGELFNRVVARYGSLIAESILIDNSREACDLFESLGGKTRFVTKEQPLGYWLKTV